jgi:hypothetical protein
MTRRARRVGVTTLVRQPLGGFLTYGRVGLGPHSRTGSRLLLIAHYGAPTIVRLP